MPANPATSFAAPASLSAGSAFGYAVDMDGTRAVVVTSPNQSGDPTTAFVYDLSAGTWSQSATFSVPAGTSGGNLPSVAVQGDLIALGVYNSVHLFKRQASGTWQSTQVITPAAGVTFGTSVSLSGTYLAVGDPNRNNSVGTAQVYEATLSGTYLLVSTLAPARLTASSFFGTRLDLDANRLVVAAPAATPGPGQFQAGSVFVYKRTGATPNASWNLEQRIDSPSGVQSGFFGTDVAISGDLMVATTNIENGQGATAVGAAYVFKRSGSNWSQTRRIEPSVAINYARFGKSVDLEGLRLLVGAPCVNRSGGNLSGTSCDDGRGAVYLYEAMSSAATDWIEHREFVRTNPVNGDHLGESVALSGAWALAGAPSSDPEKGTAHFFDAPESTDLAGSHFALSLSQGGTYTMQLDAGAANGGLAYFIYGSEFLDLAGGSIGLTATCTLPLIIDTNTPSLTPYGKLVQSVLIGGSDPHLGAYSGVLDSSGRATATLSIAPGENPSFLTGAGTLYHIFFLADTQNVVYTSNISTVTIVQ